MEGGNIILSIPSEDKGNTGTYMIKNLINNKVYVGQTVLSFSKRLSKHKYELINNKHPNQYLQKDWNEYGEDNFAFIILELCTNESIDDLEVYWMSFYNSRDRNHGYNIATGGSDGSHAEESKLKQSKAKMGKLFTDEHKRKLRENHWDSSGANNGMFARKNADAVSIFRGVEFRKDRKRYVAKIRINKKVKQLGSFKNEIDAAKTWDKSCWELHHRLDILNFPEEYATKGGDEI